MAKFNKERKGIIKTVNHEGAEAYKPSQKLELMLRTLSFMMSGDSYYTKEKNTSDAISKLVASISTKDPDYVLKLATFAREEMHLRTVPVFLLVEYAKAGVKKVGAYKTVPKILQRADEPQEALAYYFASSGSRKVPAMLKKGLALTLNNFDEYQFAKYNRKGTVTLKDTIFITHPTPVDEDQQKLFDKIVEDNLAIPDTWETYISMHGSTKQNWEHILPKMGYMATLRNLRNFVEKDVDLTVPIGLLTRPNAVKNSKQFPYRFFSAYKELAYKKSNMMFEYGDRDKTAPTKLLDALHTAMDLSVSNLERIEGKTFIASDNSGSMSATVSEKSKVSNIDIASLFSAISLHICDEAKVGVFGNTYATIPLSKKSTILDNMQKIRNTDVGHSTDAWLAIQHILDSKEYYDRIFLFSDMQCYNTYTNYGYSTEDLRSCLKEYRDKVNPKCRLYSFDLASYGLLKFPESDPLTCPISGYSDAIFKFIPLFEKDRNKMVDYIESYPI